MAIIWNNTDKKFVATAEAGLGDSWANAFDEDAFFNVGGQAGVTKPVSLPAMKVYKWVSTIEISDVTYILWKNSTHLIEVVSEINNKAFFDGKGSASYLGWGEKISGNPQNGVIIAVDDTNYYLKSVARMKSSSLNETKLYDSVLRTLRRQDSAASIYGLQLRHLEGEIQNVIIEGFRCGYTLNKLNNNIVVENIQVIDSGELFAGFQHVAEMSVPVKKIFVLNCPRGIVGNGGATPNIDFWDTEVNNSSVFSVGTFSTAYAITVRVIDSINPWSPIYIDSDANPQAIEECYSLKIHGDSGAKIYLEDTNGLPALQVYSGSKLNGEVDNSQVLIDVDDGTDFTVGEVMKVNMEHMLVAGINVNQLTVTREYNSTTAAAHGDNMWIWKVPDYVTLDGNGDLAVEQPEGSKDYLVIPKRRWDKVALDLTTFNDHKIKIEKAGLQTYEDTITEYPTKGIQLEVALQTRLYEATALKTTVRNPVYKVSIKSPEIRVSL